MAWSRALQARVKTDAESPAFFYVPKGKAVSQENWALIAEFLKALDKYRQVPWNEAQPRYVRDLRKRRLIKPYKDHVGGFSAVGRMQFPVWRSLGLAWINEDGVPEVTEIGRRFVEGRVEARKKLLSMQVHRYQFWNPTNAKHFAEFNTIPVLSLYKLLLNIGWYIGREEFILLGSRVRDLTDATEVASLIDDFRSCSLKDQADLQLLANTLAAQSHTKNERGTTYVKVSNSLGYIWNFFGLSKYIRVEPDRITIPRRHRRAVREIVDASYEAEIVEYRSAQDWLARYGEVPGKGSWERPWATPADAREYYQRIGRIDAAAEALAREKTRISAERLDEYKRVQILERVLEDILEQNLEKLEAGLSLVGRQYSTAVGPIDLLAQDKNKVYVVIELKRGRTGDRVIGQVARYLGWVTERMAQGDESRVRAIVVGREYDAKFAAAVGQISRLRPFTYDIRVRFDRWRK